MTVHESDWVWITLTQQMLDYCNTIAHKRQDNAEEYDLGPMNNAPTEHDEALAMHIRGTRGECAGYVYLKPVKWNRFKVGRTAMDEGLADLEDWIDVKARSESWHSLIVQRDDPPDWGYVLVCAHEHPRYCLIGWCYGHEAKRPEYWDDPAGGRPAFFVRQDNPILRPVASLMTEVRKRQGFTDAERAGYPNGFVGNSREGHFIHYCQCGAWATNSEKTALLKDQPGTWWCPVCYKEKNNASQETRAGHDQVGAASSPA